MVEVGYFGLFLLFTGGLAAGVTAAIVNTWALRALTYSLDTRLTVVEGKLLSEVRSRASAERFKAPRKDEELLAALTAKQTAAAPKPWWETLPTSIPRAYDGK